MKVFDNWTTWPQAEAGLRLLVAALLHDVVEDTACTLDRVRDRFGPRVAYLRRLAAAPRDAVLVRLADRLSNVQRLDRHPRPEKRRSSYRETVEWILPLAPGVPFFHDQFGRWRERFAELG